MMNETPNNMIEYEQRMRLMEKTISQHLSEKDAKDWHVQFAEKMETVKNFEAFYHNFMIGVLEIALPHDKHGVVQPVIDLHRNYKNATEEDWNEARAKAKAAWVEASAWAKAKAAWAEASAWAARAAARAAFRAAAEASAGVFDADATQASAGVFDADATQASAWASAWQEIGDAFLQAYGGE